MIKVIYIGHSQGCACIGVCRKVQLLVRCECVDGLVKKKNCPLSKVRIGDVRSC